MSCMVTGAANAEAALLLIDAHEGVQENSRRHGYMLWMLGIKKIVVLVNKMDLVGYDQSVFERIREEYSAYLSGIGVQPMVYIPVSGRDGAGVAAHNGQMSWYDGPTLLQALDSFEKARALTDQPVRMPVQDVYKFSDMGDTRRIVAGTLSSGTLQPGDAVVFYPSAKRTVLKSLEGFNQETQTQVSAGNAVGFTMAEQIYVRRGQIVWVQPTGKPKNWCSKNFPWRKWRP